MTNKQATIAGAPRISLNEAITRAENWRSLLRSLPSNDKSSHSKNNDAPLISPDLVFRAINIRLEDIDWLRREHPEASSIRLYLSIPDPNLPFQICGMLVPVDNQNMDMLTAVDDVNTTPEEASSSNSMSTIYDFTQPCPTMCNTISPLFSATNDVLPFIKYKNS